MLLSPGARLGPYEVVAHLGSGGMGEVYRAHDPRLQRDVALKVLPETFAHDADRLARFQREAQTLAALNHPNIAAIHGLEEGAVEAGHHVRALVMELVEGEDLSQRIARGAIPLDDALPIAKQIAEALEAAHEQGIIHRDLKPANIKVRPDGTVKVLDFGLAKALGPAEAGHYVREGLGNDADNRSARLQPGLSQLPTITSPALVTGAGVILGTAAYMSPEQARGNDADKRADLWAFGVVLFEMLTGARLLEGATVSDTLAFVLTKAPDWTRLPAKTPAPIRTLLRRCLEKDRKRRLDSAAAARLEIEEALAPPAVDVTQASATSRTASSRVLWQARTATAVLGIAAMATMVPAVQHLRESSPPLPPEMRTEISTPQTDDPASFALSPDGRQIVFAASAEGRSRLWLRSLATTTAQPLAGTEDGRYPFWAPDGRAIGFFSGGSLKRLDLGGDAPLTLAPGLGVQGGTWGADGVIVYSPSATSALMRVPAAGGQPTMVGMLGPEDVGHVYPRFLPDGRRFLFFVTGAPSVAGIYLGTLDGVAPVRLTAAASSAEYLPSGWLLWVRADTLVAQRLDLARPALSDDPVVLAGGVTSARTRSPISVAATGLIAFRMNARSQRQLTWFDRSGGRLGSVGEPDENLAEPNLSPDGRRVAAVRSDEDLWLLDGTRAIRFTFDAGGERIPVWSPDGSRIVFRKTIDLYQKRTNGAGETEPLVVSSLLKVPSSWSRDGRFLMYHSIEQTDADLWVVPTMGDRTPLVFLKTPFREAWGAFSPDGRWVAYQSDESGRPEIYVRPFGLSGAASALRPGSGQAAGAESSVRLQPDQTGGQWQVSTAGGIRPLWRQDGQELYYLNPAGAMMVAPVRAAGSTFETGAPAQLFPTRINGGGTETQQGRQYDVAPDGRFLINTELDTADAPITLIQNWTPEARR